MDAVAVALVVLRGVDATLGRDRVGPARRVVERERLHLIAEFTEGGGGGRSGKARTHHDDLELALVGRVDEFLVGDEVLPLVGEWPLGDLGVEGDAHSSSSPSMAVPGTWVTASGSNSTTPASTATGNETLPTTMIVATPVAR